MIETLLFLFGIAFIFDGIKILIETMGMANVYEGERIPEETTAVVSVYNNIDILDAIDSIKREFNKIIIINDGSDDGTQAILQEFGDTISTEDTETGKLYRKEYKGVNITVLDNFENRGKVDSIHMGLQYVDTDYTFICDDDIKFSDEFEIPATLLRDGEADAVSFFVIPEESKNKFWYNIQLHEYVKSMQIGRRFAGKSKSVECISGCSGLFRTKRLQELSLEHSSEWEGEDLERTLIELMNGGKVIYSEQVIYTVVPNSLMEVTKQRVLGWWGGLYRNIPRFFRLFKSKKSQVRLRFETLYNMISLIFDPIKLISLIYLIVSFNWIILGLLYIIYALFELFIYGRYKSLSPDLPKLRYILLYPIYGMLNLIYRISAGIYMGYRKFKKVFAITAFILLGLVGVAVAQDNPKGIVEYDYGYYEYGVNDFEREMSLYAGYDNYYISAHDGIYRQINVGMYHNNFMFDVGLRNNIITPYVLYEHWLGNNTVRGHARYNYNYGSIDTNIYPNTTVVGLGYGRYNEGNRYIIDVMQELDRNYSTTIVGKAKQKIVNGTYLTGVSSINLDKHHMHSLRLDAHFVHISSTYYSNYDYTGNEFISWNAGITIKFN